MRHAQPADKEDSLAAAKPVVGANVEKVETLAKDLPTFTPLAAAVAAMP